MNIKRMTQLLIVVLTLNTVAPAGANTVNAVAELTPKPKMTAIASTLKWFNTYDKDSWLTSDVKKIGFVFGLAAIAASCGYFIWKRFKSAQSKKLAASVAEAEKNIQAQKRNAQLKQWVSDLKLEQLNEVTRQIQNAGNAQTKITFFPRSSYMMECSPAEFDLIKAQCLAAEVKLRRAKAGSPTR